MLPSGLTLKLKTKAHLNAIRREVPDLSGGEEETFHAASSIFWGMLILGFMMLGDAALIHTNRQGRGYWQCKDPRRSGGTRWNG